MARAVAGRAADALSPETALEIATGLVLGTSGDVPRPTSGVPTGSALAALEAAVLPALLRPPCLVTFSGGLDSSLVLAVATRVARRHGLDDPVPFSWRFPGVPGADEAAWQDRVLSALRLEDRVARVAGPDELDFVGPRAQAVLVRHGVRHPPNLHFHEAPVALARGGSLLTGAGGDQVLSGWRRPENRTPVRRAKDAVPPALRVRVRNLPARRLPWIRPAVAAQVLADRMREEAAEPVRLGERASWHLGRRDLALTLANLHGLGTPHDVVVSSPLADPAFVRALGRELGDQRAPRRPALVRALAGDAVPAVVWQPRRKARFGAVFLGEPSRALAAGWDGEGLADGPVDPAALRQVWSRWPVPLATAGLLQQVFLARRPDDPRPTDQRPTNPRATTRRTSGG